jgi:CDGSH-type Zn-finger protein
MAAPLAAGFARLADAPFGPSEKQPFCDGSHKGSGMAPMRWTAAENGTAWFCTCKQMGKSPMCDGSHKRLPAG